MSFLAIVSILTVATFCGTTSAQRYQNPVLDGADYPDPGVLFHEGIYYAVTTTNNNEFDKFPIHASVDLQTWQLVGYVFREETLPKWSRVNDNYWAPEIHVIGGKFVCYFTARDVKTELMGIGVAVADSPVGPYTPQDEVLLVMGGMWCLDSTIINFNNQLMLLFVGGQYIRARNLTEDGLAFKDDITIDLIHPDQPWEGVTTEGPWFIFRDGYFYIFYSGNNFCSDGYALGVARSINSPVGPYEKLPYPILVSNDQFKGPGHGSVVVDNNVVDGWVFVHHGWKAGAVCGDNHRYMFSSTLRWGNNHWPLNMTIGG